MHWYPRFQNQKPSKLCWTLVVRISHHRNLFQNWCVGFRKSIFCKLSVYSRRSKGLLLWYCREVWKRSREPDEHSCRMAGSGRVQQGTLPLETTSKLSLALLPSDVVLRDMSSLHPSVAFIVQKGHYISTPSSESNLLLGVHTRTGFTWGSRGVHMDLTPTLKGDVKVGSQILQFLLQMDWIYSSATIESRPRN